MSLVALTQRVEVIASRNERRDCLDQRWTAFLDRCGLVALPVPNRAPLAAGLVESARVSGIVLTGGGDLVAYGGAAPERDATEAALLRLAIERGLPVIGVCRGMQSIQHFFGVPLAKVAGHVAKTQEIQVEGAPAQVNSYHDLGTRQTTEDLEVWAVATDGVVKAVRHRRHRLTGIMWHPERIEPFRDADVRLFGRTFRPD